MSNAIVVKPLPIVAASAALTEDGHDPIFVGNDQLGVVWKSGPGLETGWFQVDLGADVAFDTIMLFGLTGAKAAWTMGVMVATAAQGPSMSSNWFSGGMPLLAGADMPSSGRGKALWMAPTTGSMPPAAARHIRIYMGVDAMQAVTVGRIVVGKRLTLDHNFFFGAAFNVRDLGSADFSSRGVLLRRRGAKLRSVGLTFSAVHRDEVLDKVHPLIEAVGNTDPIALVTNPDPSDERQNLMYFGPLIGDLGTVWARAGRFEWRVNMVGMDV